ncbi:chascon isoform d-related [Anaeramoeba flamelloides]|uniref:Chascon isoform d-related n=1 Tax=Anaeramoeba flamelloides TaxID=1746091 RepID=A0AAV7ZIM3_9EUKA|nr:chascon isoform d-related [Anaeramoeba flamelloides]
MESTKKEEPSDIKLTKLENTTFASVSSLVKSQLENSAPIQLKRSSQPITNDPPKDEKTNLILRFLDLRLKQLPNKNNNKNKNTFDNEQNQLMGNTNSIGNLESNNSNTQDNNKKIRYGWDPRFTSSVPMTDTLQNVNPGLVLNLYINCFSFFHENVCHSYDPQFKPLFESIINGRINDHLFHTIRKNKSKFYNGYLVVDILDYRNRMSNRLAKPDVSTKIIKDPNLQQQPQQQQQQQPQQQSQQQMSNNNSNRMKLEIKQEPSNRSRQSQQQLNPKDKFQQQPQRLQKTVKEIEFNERTDKKRKVLLSLDEESFRIEVTTMQYQEYSLLVQKERFKQKNRMLKLGINQKQQIQQAQQHFERIKKQLQILARWGSEKQTRFQQKLLLVRSNPTCFDSSIDILKIANYYFNNKHKTNYLGNKNLDVDSKFHHNKELNNKKLLKKILDLNYNQHKKKIRNLDYGRISFGKFKLKKKELEKEKKKLKRLEKTEKRKTEKEKENGDEKEKEMEIEIEKETDSEEDSSEKKGKESHLERRTESESETESESGSGSGSGTESESESESDVDKEKEIYMDIEKQKTRKKRNKKKRKRKKNTRFSRSGAMMDMIQPLNTETSGIEFIFKPKKKYKGLTIFRHLLSQRKKLISEQSFSEYIRRLIEPMGGSVNSNLQKFLIKRAKDTNKTIQNEKYTVYYKKNPFLIEQCHNKPSVFTEEQIGKMKQIEEIEMHDIRTRSYDNFSSHHHSPLVQIYSSVARPSIFLSVENPNESISNTSQSTTSVSDHATIPIPSNVRSLNSNKANKDSNYNQQNLNSNINASQNNINLNNSNQTNSSNINNQINNRETIIGENNIIDRQIFRYIKPEKNERAIIKLRVDPESGIHEIDVTFKIGNKEITKTKTTGERVQTKSIFHHYHEFMKKNGWKTENIK